MWTTRTWATLGTILERDKLGLVSHRDQEGMIHRGVAGTRGTAHPTVAARVGPRARRFRQEGRNRFGFGIKVGERPHVDTR